VLLAHDPIAQREAPLDDVFLDPVGVLERDIRFTLVNGSIGTRARQASKSSSPNSAILLSGRLGIEWAL